LVIFDDGATAGTGGGGDERDGAGFGGSGGERGDAGFGADFGASARIIASSIVVERDAATQRPSIKRLLGPTRCACGRSGLWLFWREVVSSAFSPLEENRLPPAAGFFCAVMPPCCRFRTASCA
jgi:hypothetical protein